MPAHAQRMSSLLAADKAPAPCRVEKRAMRCGERAALKAEAQGTHGAHLEHVYSMVVRLQIGSRERGEERT